MENVVAVVEGTKLKIEIDLTKDLGPSSTGKTNILAKSGFASVPGLSGFGFTLNAWRPKVAAK
jgi:hypothetical protein